jgi:phosphoribosylglycinamide formyltransferase-1
LASGSGSNFEALTRDLNTASSPATVSFLLCNVPSAGVIERATRLGVEALVLDHRAFPSRDAYDARVAQELVARGIGLVCLAGYMRLVTPALLAPFAGRVINVHPALLPSFPGLHAPRQALAAGVAIAGCTVHFVDEGTDTGPIIAQAAVPVLPSDDESSLTNRIQVEERRLFPMVVRAIATGKIRLDGRRVLRSEVIA